MLRSAKEGCFLGRLKTCAKFSIASSDKLVCGSLCSFFIVESIRLRPVKQTTVYQDEVSRVAANLVRLSANLFFLLLLLPPPPHPLLLLLLLLSSDQLHAAGWTQTRNTNCEGKHDTCLAQQSHISKVDFNYALYALLSFPTHQAFSFFLPLCYCRCGCLCWCFSVPLIISQSTSAVAELRFADAAVSVCPHLCTKTLHLLFLCRN